MTDESWISAAALYLSRLRQVLAQIDPAAAGRGLELVARAWRAGCQIITCGNGGSAVTALHFITDWNKSLSGIDGLPFRGRTLCDNMGLLTAHANDHSYYDVFRDQLQSVLLEGDLLIAISVSGNSENVLRAVDYANERGAMTLGLCGQSGGKLRTRARQAIWIPSEDMQLCEDAHAAFGHMVMQGLNPAYRVQHVPLQ